MAKIQINSALAIDESEIDEQFVLASGPGGQNVNKVATAVQLRFDAMHSPSLSDDIRARLQKLAGRRMSKAGILIISAQRFRLQERNREDARAKLIELLAKASMPPKQRRKTKTPLSVVKRRLEKKTNRAELKRQRAKPVAD